MHNQQFTSPTISKVVKLVLELPVASFVRVMMKASSEDALCLLVDIAREKKPCVL
jgi:hypothetical protein